jgi:hypothetical protein
MAKRRRNETRFGDVPPKYNFALNPYPDLRFTSCPRCRAKTGQRKLPLLIHVEPGVPIALNYTNRYCKRCELLIGHKHEIEHHLTELFRDIGPELVGNRYLIFATVEKKAWRENMRQPRPVLELRAHVSDFKRYEELRMTMAGWFPKGQEPPVMKPVASTEWVRV